jgi:hypothetical protein
MALLNLPSAVRYWKALPRYVNGAAQSQIRFNVVNQTRIHTVQHPVIFVSHLIIDELLSLDAIIGKTAGNCCKTFSLRSVSANSLTSTIQTAYVKSSALDESIGAPLQRWPIAGLKDGL